MKLRQFSEGIWTADSPLSVLGLELGARMTVVDYSGQGDLWVHSPLKPDEELIADINNIGKVKYIVAPNRWHHMFVGSFLRSFPEAKVYGAPGLDKKRKDLNFEGILERDVDYPWSESVSHKVLSGAPLLNEVIFCHKKSRTLIVTDLGLHICEDSSFYTKLIFRLMGIYKKFGWSSLEKKLFIKEKGPFAESVGDILGWDFDKIIMAHGRVVGSDGRTIFREAFS